MNIFVRASAFGYEIGKRIILEAYLLIRFECIQNSFHSNHLPMETTFSQQSKSFESNPLQYIVIRHTCSEIMFTRKYAKFLQQCYLDVQDFLRKKQFIHSFTAKRIKKNYYNFPVFRTKENMCNIYTARPTALY